MSEVKHFFYKLWMGKKKHWYGVRFIYKDNQHNRIFDYTTSLGLMYKYTICNNRDVKIISEPLHKTEGIPKHLLCNGSLVFEPVCYLGRFELTPNK